MTFTETDSVWMQRALALARKGAGRVSPNPMVGCVIVSEDGNVIGEGYHRAFGKDHAEVAALQSVREQNQLKGATVYVTLEPCSHHGKTPPCADLLAGLPIKRVVVSMKDPNPNVNGKGLKRIREAGIATRTGLLEPEARKLNRFFIHYTEFGRPWITLKAAQTADGYVAAPNGDSKWITGMESRKQVHRWRSEYDAVLVGRHTAELDNPSLTVRHIEGRQPRRVVIDGPGTLPRELNLFSDNHEEKTIHVTWNRDLDRGEDPMLQLMQRDYFRGQRVLTDKKEGHSDLTDVCNKLGEKGIASVLVEAGPALATALFREDLVDQLELFIAPRLLGGGTRSFTGLGINRMEDIRPFRSVEWRRFGEDQLLTAII